MGCFSCCIVDDDDDDDQFKVEMKTAMFLSRYENEDSRARQEIAAKEAEIDLSKENHDRLLDEQVEMLKKKGKSKRDDDDDDDQSKDDINTALTISRFAEEDRKARQEKEEKEAEIDLSKNKQEPKDKGKGKKEDVDAPEDKEQKMHPKDDVKDAVNHPPASVSDRGKSVIEGGNSVNPRGLCCEICQGPFALDEIRKKEKYHKHCYKHRSICYVCKRRFPLNEEGKREYKEHEFWKEKHCPDHENDETHKCCSCERLEPKGEATYVKLDDFRWLCLECMESSVMDSCESVPLLDEIKGFFESKALIIDKEFPLLMVEIQALNKAEAYEKFDHHRAALTRGLCMSEEQTIPSIIVRPTGRGPGNRLTGMVTVEQEVSGCEVTGILIIYGLPRLLTGYILAHEMMHAWLRLNGYKKLKKDDRSRALEKTTNEISGTRTVYQKKEEKYLKEEHEEGLCQVLALMWLESHNFGFTEAEAASSSSSRTPLATTTSKKGDAWTDFEKRFVEFCIYQIKEDESPVYGQGFKEIYKMMLSNNYSVKATLNEIVNASKS